MQGLDAHNRFANAQAVTTTAISANVIDLVATGRHMGFGEPMVVMVQLDVAASAGDNDETYSVGLETDDVADLSTSPTVLNTVTFTRGDAAGTRKFIDVPLTAAAYQRFMGLRFTQGGTTPTATYTAYLMSRKAAETLAYFPNNIISK